MVIRLRRVYEQAERSDGYRVLVERLWPRGVSKERAKVDLWLKEAGSSNELRTWFAHDPKKWQEYYWKYFDELKARPGVIAELAQILRAHDVVTFLYSARDEEHNNAVALKEFLETRL